MSRSNLESKLRILTSKEMFLYQIEIQHLKQSILNIIYIVLSGCKLSPLLKEIIVLCSHMLIPSGFVGVARKICPLYTT